MQAVDAYLLAPKRLADEMPNWVTMPEDDRCVVNWPILEPDGSARGFLCFHVPVWRKTEPSVTLVFRGAAVTQLDLAPTTVRKRNPPWAFNINASSHVEGNHWHPWRLNRQHVLRSKRWELPCREEIPQTIRKVPQALVWLADQVGLTLHHEHYAFEGPRRTDLFGGDAA